MKTHKFNGKTYKLILDGVVQGFADLPEEKQTFTLYIASNLGPKKYLEVSIHEALHASFPDKSEADIDKAGEDISRFLWRLGYRRG